MTAFKPGKGGPHADASRAGVVTSEREIGIAIAPQVLDILEEITGTNQVRVDPDLALFERGLLDSLGFVEVIVALDETLGVEISPAEVEREQWATPRKIIAYLEARAERARP
jgi:D-alanine--poly(phosphoribitol) ligase subunit 2